MKTNNAYLGLDIGGTGAKAGVFDAGGLRLGQGHCSFTPQVVDSGHVEIDIEEIYRAAQKAVIQAVREADRPIDAMSVVSQGETFVSLDAKDRPLHPAILWYDSRASLQAASLNAAVRAAGSRAHSLDAMFTVSKIRWLQEHRPEIMSRVRRFLLLPDYIAYRLTGMAAIDANTVWSSGMIASDGTDYDAVILQAAGIDRKQVSEIYAPGQPVGPTSTPVAAEWGLAPQTLLSAGTNDQYAGALGAGNCRLKILTETTGTCQAAVTLTERLPDSIPDGILRGRYPIDPYCFVLAYAKTAGVVLDWFRRECAGGTSFEILNAEAANVPIGCRGVTMVPHFDGMISPVPKPELRGCFCHLNLHHARADLYRSILEALAFNLRGNMEWMRQTGLIVETVRCIGGGAQNALWLQMKADVIGQSVEQPVVTEAAVLGAAMLAAWGFGAFASLAEASADWYRVGRVFTPDKDNHDRYAEPFRRYRELIERTGTKYASA